MKKANFVAVLDIAGFEIFEYNGAEEKQKLIQEIESLKEGKSELGLQVARMNRLVTAGQEALQQEQKTADLLREQLAKVKGSVDSNLAESTTTNNEVLTS